MNYEILDFQINSLLKIGLKEGESILAEAGSMMYMKNKNHNKTRKKR